MLENRASALSEAIYRIHMRTSLGVELKEVLPENGVTASDILIKLQTGQDNCAAESIDGLGPYGTIGNPVEDRTKSQKLPAGTLVTPPRVTSQGDQIEENSFTDAWLIPDGNNRPSDSEPDLLSPSQQCSNFQPSTSSQDRGIEPPGGHSDLSIEEAFAASHKHWTDSNTPVSPIGPYETPFMQGYLLGARQTLSSLESLSLRPGSAQLSSGSSSASPCNDFAFMEDMILSPNSLLLGTNSSEATSASLNSPFTHGDIYSPSDQVGLTSERGYFDLNTSHIATGMSSLHTETYTSSEFLSLSESSLITNEQNLGSTFSTISMADRHAPTRRLSLDPNTLFNSDMPVSSLSGAPIVKISGAETSNSGIEDRSLPGFAGQEYIINNNSLYQNARNQCWPLSSSENYRPITNEVYHALEDRYRSV